MAKFDIVESSMSGYRAVWDNRAAIVRHALIPLLVKLGTVALITLLGLWGNFLRQGLVFLPAYFAEGVLVAFIIRMILSEQGLTQDPKDSAPPFMRDIAAGTIIYVLIKLVLSVLVGMTMHRMALTGGDAAAAEPADPTLSSFMLGVAGLALMIWSFRLLWLYIPAALGVSVNAFLMRSKAYATSFYMMGCWIMCFLPFYLVLLFVTSMLYGLFPVAEGAEPVQAAVLLVASVQAIVELVMILVSSVAMAYGVKQIMEGQENG